MVKTVKTATTTSTTQSKTLLIFLLLGAIVIQSLQVCQVNAVKISPEFSGMQGPSSGRASLT